MDVTPQREDALKHCTDMLMLIGPEWLGEPKRRLDQPRDWVRQEIAEAMRRGLRVVPVLLENATLPAERNRPFGPGGE
jgi:hypothetical protein